jgi:E3 SUMO-protein ligase PIAS1
MLKWCYFHSTQRVRNSVSYNTVDRLKSVICGLNEECHTHLAKSGKKADLIERICQILDYWKSNANVDSWNRAKDIINQVAQNGM